MSRRQRAGTAIAAMLPVTIAALALWRCGCGAAGLVLEITTAIGYGMWIDLARE